MVIICSTLNNTIAKMHRTGITNKINFFPYSSCMTHHMGIHLAIICICGSICNSNYLYDWTFN